jgi:hypothetical protein
MDGSDARTQPVREARLGAEISLEGPGVADLINELFFAWFR